MVGAATVKQRPPYVFRLNLGTQVNHFYFLLLDTTPCTIPNLRPQTIL